MVAAVVVGAAMLVAGAAASVVAAVADLLAAEVAVASVVALAFVVAGAAAAASGSGWAAGGSVVLAAHPGERAAGAKSNDVTAGLTKDSAKLTISFSPVASLRRHSGHQRRLAWCQPLPLKRRVLLRVA
jgi:hypothetical protein